MSNLNDDPKRRADALGLRIIEAEPDLLQLDLDSPRAIATYRAELLRLRSEYAPNDFAVSVLETQSNGGNLHVYIRLSFTLPIGERIALQLVLGSDPVREKLSLLRHLLKTHRVPLVLFEKPFEEERVRYWMKEHHRNG